MKAKIPNIQRITDSLKDLEFVNGNEASKKVIQTVFAKIEFALQKTAELKVGNFSIEHIENQSTGKVWIGKIGNMVPLDEKLNNEIKNSASFNDKKKIYKKSQFKTVAKFLEYNAQPTWTRDSSEKWLQMVASELQKATTLLPI